MISRNIAVAVAGIYEERALAQNLTGECIVFARHEGRNHYLCLATHDEVRPDPRILAERISGCTPRRATWLPSSRPFALKIGCGDLDGALDHASLRLDLIL